MSKKIAIGYMALCLLAAGLALFAPDLVHAQAQQAQQAQEGLVQCGNGDGGPESGCKLNDLFSTAARLINYLLSGGAVVAVGGVIYGGYLMVTSAGNEGRKGSGKKAVTNSLIGLGVILVSYLLVRTLFVVLAANEGTQPLEAPDQFIDSGKGLIQ